MAKIILEFDSCEEEDEARTALDGYKWKLAIWDLDQKLRGVVKYESSILEYSDKASNAEIEVADTIRLEIREILNSYGLNLD
jgi:hypothetical protein